MNNKKLISYNYNKLRMINENEFTCEYRDYSIHIIFSYFFEIPSNDRLRDDQKINNNNFVTTYLMSGRRIEEVIGLSGNGIKLKFGIISNSDGIFHLSIRYELIPKEKVFFKRMWARKHYIVINSNMENGNKRERMGVSSMRRVFLRGTIENEINLNVYNGGKLWSQELK